MRCICKCLLTIFYVIGLVLISLGLILIIMGPGLIRKKVIDEKILVNGTKSFDKWMYAGETASVYISFYVWDIQNSNDIVKRGMRPSLKQKGPYTYRIISKKGFVEFKDNNTLLKYRKTRSYIFEPSLSIGPDTDIFTSINLPLMGIASMKPPFSPTLWNSIVKPIFRGEHLFRSFRVKDYLFGYTDPAFAKLKSGIEAIGLGLEGFQIPSEFGIFTGENKNGSVGGSYTINTGVHDIRQLNMIHRWKNMSELPYWDNKLCNMLNGTVGGIFPPFINSKDKLHIFVAGICRSIYITFSGEVINRNIPMYSYKPPSELFSDGSCVPADKRMKTGVVNIGPCKNNIPIAISQPHFLNADSSYINAFDGLDPKEQKHMTYLNIEPITGYALNASKRMQMNIIVGKRRLLPRETRRLNETVWPLIWLDEHFALDEETAQLFNSKVLKPLKMIDFVKQASITAGALILSICIFVQILLMYFKRPSHKSQSVKQKSCSLSDNSDQMPFEKDSKPVGCDEAITYSTNIYPKLSTNAYCEDYNLEEKKSFISE